MRVLAIRGRNLASLAGDFAVDFEDEPLGSAGIFAITGPTGAGKSTLLDAMCLALFGKVPRLDGASSSRAESDAIAGDDARAILRHGEGDGFAEIDFLARDTHRYRARWSVWRADKKPTAKLQNTKHSLIRLDDEENLSSTKTETLKLIADLIGLSADQFRRAVMLAQGDFEAFIRANDSERAELLENLTGSRIYTDLGRAAYEKAMALRREQQAIRDRIDAQHGLDDEVRATAEATAEAARQDDQRATKDLGKLEAAGRWEEEGHKLAGLILADETRAQVAKATQDDATSRREALRTRKAAFVFAAEWLPVRRDGHSRVISFPLALPSRIKPFPLTRHNRGVLSDHLALALAVFTRDHVVPGKASLIGYRPGS